MALSPLAGKPAPRSILENIPRLISDYYTLKPDASLIDEMVSFGTSGHRGTSKHKKFNEDHILSVSQAICDYRRENGITGPLFLGMDTHALSEPALITAVEVLAANRVHTRIQAGRGYTPTPVISHAILTYNQAGPKDSADGIVITPSHNPPSDGGFKYNPPNGGPADTHVTKWIQDRANELMLAGLKGVNRIAFEKAMAGEYAEEYDYVAPYVDDLANMVDMEAIKQAGLKIGADPLGGSGVHFWEPIEEKYKLGISLVNPVVDPTFGFMSVDKDGKIRMDCSSPYAMRSLIDHKDKYDIAFGNDADYDRHGIVTRTGGLLNPNAYLAVAIDYLFNNRPDWPDSTQVGKTLVSSSMIDRVAKRMGRGLVEVPVGFKWFVDGLLTGGLGFGGEESAGASYLRKNGQVWTTDKDGIIMDLLACEIIAKTGKDPFELYQDLEKEFGSPVYQRLDSPATREQKQAFKMLTPDMVKATELAGEPIQAKLTKAPGNDAPIGGLKVVTENGWFAARPSGTEDIYKIYAESFKGQDHLARVQEEAKSIVSETFKEAGV